MTFRMKLRATAAVAVVLASGAHAAAPKKHAAPRSANAALLEEVRALRAEVQSLRERVDAQGQNQAEATARINTAQVVAETAQAKAETAQTQVAAVAATPPVTPEQVDTRIAGAIDKEHHADKFHFKGVTLTPGGFLELAGIYRSHFQGDDIASNFSIPFPSQSHQSRTAEGRFSARQSRLSLLAEGQVNPATRLAMYGEFDFQGAAQTANSNQSNSYQPRIRVLYGTIDWDRGDHGLHLLAGQNWSLLTTQGKGITPRSEAIPPQIDAQYIPGFAWTRQPGVRLTGDFMDHHLWLAVAAENPQTTFGGTAVPASETSVLAGQNGTTAPPPGSFQQFYNGPGATLSLNHVPDVIGKVAYEGAVGGRNLHLEGFGIWRTFTAHVNNTSGDHNRSGWGVGGGVTLQVVPKLLDAQVSGIYGRGVGRYGSAGLPDVTFDKEGFIHPIKEYMLLAGLTAHASRALDLYGFAGEEREYEDAFDSGTAGLGLPVADNRGCLIEGSALGCAGNTRAVRQLTFGFWDKFYQGSFGRAQIGLQYSYTERQLFTGLGGDPTAKNDMVFVSFRYYPF